MRVTALLKGLQFIAVPYDQVLQTFAPLEAAGWDVQHNKGRATKFFKLVASRDSQRLMFIVEPEHVIVQDLKGKMHRWKFPSQIQKALAAVKKLIGQLVH